MQLKDPLHPSDEERAINREQLRRANRTRKRMAGTPDSSSAPDNGLEVNRVAAKVDAMRRKWKEQERVRSQQAAEELRQRRAAFTGDCEWCFDEGGCERCDRGREYLRVQRLQWEEREAERRRNSRLEILTTACIPPRRFAHTMDSYPLPQLPAFQQLAAFLSAWDMRRGLILTGPYGTGKTGLLIAAMREVADRYVDTTHRMLFIPAPDLMDALRAGYSDGSYDDRIEKLKWIRLLAIDDLGAERPTEWTQEKLFAIVNSRYEHDYPLFATTNYGMQELAERLGPRVLERLLETCDLIAVKGPNLRRPGAHA